MLESFRNKKILVIVAHPDDELLGLGATVNRLVNDFKCESKSIILGEGITSRDESRDPEKRKNELSEHHKNLENAQKVIGYNEWKTYNFPDNRFDSVDLLDIVKVVEKEKEQFEPDIIFTHHGGDTNIDHQITFEAVMTASRPLQNENTLVVFTFETPSSTEWQAFNYKNYFTPNFFVEVKKKNLEAKLRGMESYIYEKRDFPHPRSTEALEILARKRGVEIGVEYAEAFMLIRSINRL